MFDSEATTIECEGCAADVTGDHCSWEHANAYGVGVELCEGCALRADSMAPADARRWLRDHKLWCSRSR